MIFQIVHKVIFRIINLLFVFFICTEAHAIKFHEAVDDWDVYSMKQNGKLICYVVSQPVEKSDKSSERESYIIVTKINKNMYEFNGAISKTLLKNQAFLQINNVKIDLFSQENLVWTKNKGDHTLIPLMKNNISLKLIWNSAKRKNNIDQYSLKGFTKALSKIDEICQ